MVKSVQILTKEYKLSYIEKPGKRVFSGFLKVNMLEIRQSLALAELGSATCGLQTVLVKIPESISP